jgi:hypothetical protein
MKPTKEDERTGREWGGEGMNALRARSAFRAWRRARASSRPQPPLTRRCLALGYIDSVDAVLLDKLDKIRATLAKNCF